MSRGGGTSSGAGAYEPGIDGLRAVAVALVLLFHGGVSWAGGGFLGVSLFFTLSGFLITRLLLTEHASTGGIDLLAFWTRRLRRLAPAATACVALALALGPWLVGDAGRVSLRWDAWSALTYWANWRAVASGNGYSELFAAPGPLDHFWSLAIEEQFYVVYPALVTLVLTRARRRPGAALAGVLVVLTSGSVVASLLTGSADLVYAGTHTRAAELLIGALAALVVHRWPVTGARSTGAVGVAGLAAVVALSGTVDLTTGWLYHGGFAAIACASAAAVVGITAPGPLRGALSWAPLVAVGRRSYGVYLVHWPLFLLLSPARTGLDGWALLALRLVASGGVAAASYRWIEQPIRMRRRLASDGRMVASSTVAAASVAALAGLGSFGAATTASATAAVGAGFTDFGAVATPAAVSSTLPSVRAATPPPAIHIAVVGGAAADPVAVDLAGEASVARVRCELDVCAQAAGAEAPSDAVVVVLGEDDRVAVSGLDGDAQVDAFVALAESLAAVVDGATGDGVPVVLADAGPDDFLRSRLGVLDLSSELVRAVDPADAAATALAGGSGSEPGPDDRLAVMVIGDSTSYGIADGLHATAGDRLHVLWAGGANCPLVRAERMRWWEGNEFDTSECPTADEWAEAAAGFRPDVVLVVSSFAEQTELRLPGHPGWSVAGDLAFASAHDGWLDDIRTIAARTGAVVTIADSPPFAEGSFAGAPMALPERIDAWNAQIAAWDAAHADVVVVPWTATLASMEANGSVRSDGVHLDHADRPRAGALIASALEGIVARLPATTNG